MNCEAVLVEIRAVALRAAPICMEYRGITASCHSAFPVPESITSAAASSDSCASRMQKLHHQICDGIFMQRQSEKGQHAVQDKRMC